MKDRDRSTSSRGFTLMEIVVVVIIMGILASIVIPNYIGTKEKALDKEAITALKLIRAANKYYYIRYSFFYRLGGAEGNLVNINNNLSLDLNSTNWVFSVTGGGTMTATATRAGRTWTINQGPTDPTCAGSCF